MRVIGTAGHVDHGKSTLVKALTGIDPDRLKEEKQRQMTIDLGFAWYLSASGEDIGIVDVPGHRDFIENMLAGVGGLDAVLLVIAADEGIMPQTREHLAILNLLKIEHGIVVLTKVDLTSDQDWLDLVELDVHTVLRGTRLESAEIVRVSAVTGEGIENLKEKISTLLGNLEPKLNHKKPRLAIDRAFSIAGFGTVVTGTLTGGDFNLGDQVELLPSGKNTRIRGIQVHKKQVATALPGSRTAINLSGIELDEVNRGETLVIPGQFMPTFRIDAQVEVLGDAGTEIRQNDHVKFFHTTLETSARVRLIGMEVLKPGETGYVQLEMQKAMVAETGDRFILRRMSPATTMGGGRVINPHPRGRYKLKDSGVLKKLEMLTKPSLPDLILNVIHEKPFINSDELYKLLGVDASIIANEILVMRNEGQVIDFAGEKNKVAYVSAGYWNHLTTLGMKKVREFHKAQPLFMGIRRKVLGKSLGIPEVIQNQWITKWIANGEVEEFSENIKLRNHQVRYSPAQTKRINEFFTILGHDPYNPPSVKTSREMLGDLLFESIKDLGAVVQVSSDVVLRKEEYRMMYDFVLEKCQEEGSITVVIFRDHFASNRKVSLGFLEHLDNIGFTERVGDNHILKKNSN